MSFFEIEAFLKSAECDSSYAAAVLGKGELDVCLAVENLQKLLLVSLFTDPLRPSKNNLTEFGKIYLEHARSALFNLQNGMLAVLNHESFMEGMSKIAINLCPTIRNELLTESIIGLLNDEVLDKVCLDVVTSNEQRGENALRFHVLFGHLSPNYKRFFKTVWSAVITRGLYASETYVRDVGIPKTVHDLINHTIIVCGSSFKNISENEYNWHLRSDYGIPKFAPSVIVSNEPSLFAAVNADLGIGPLFCHQSQHLHRILPWISGPVSIMEFAIRIDIPEKLRKHIDIFNTILKTNLKAAGIELIDETYEYEN